MSEMYGNNYSQQYNTDNNYADGYGYTPAANEEERLISIYAGLESERIKTLKLIMSLILWPSLIISAFLFFNFDTGVLSDFGFFVFIASAVLTVPYIVLMIALKSDPQKIYAKEIQKRQLEYSLGPVGLTFGEWLFIKSLKNYGNADFSESLGLMKKERYCRGKRLKGHIDDYLVRSEDRELLVQTELESSSDKRKKQILSFIYWPMFLLSFVAYMNKAEGVLYYISMAVLITCLLSFIVYVIFMVVWSFSPESSLKGKKKSRYSERSNRRPGITPEEKSFIKSLSEEEGKIRYKVDENGIVSIECTKDRVKEERKLAGHSLLLIIVIFILAAVTYALVLYLKSTGSKLFWAAFILDFVFAIIFFNSDFVSPKVYFKSITKEAQKVYNMRDFNGLVRYIDNNGYIVFYTIGEIESGCENQMPQ